MTELQFRELERETIAPSTDVLMALRPQLRGSLCLQDEAGYDEARTIWNAMIDRRPGAVVRCGGASDVMRAVHLARDNGLLVAVRGGGHNISGNAVCEGGLLIDLSPMRSVRVDPKKRTARVEPGVTLGEFDKEAQAFGLATPLGINSTTGVTGTHTRWRLPVAQPKIRVHGGQSNLRRCGDRRRRARSGKRSGEPRPLLGHPRRRRQFRRCDVVRVQTASGLGPT